MKKIASTRLLAKQLTEISSQAETKAKELNLNIFDKDPDVSAIFTTIFRIKTAIEVAQKIIAQEGTKLFNTCGGGGTNTERAEVRGREASPDHRRNIDTLVAKGYGEGNCFSRARNFFRIPDDLLQSNGLTSQYGSLQGLRGDKRYHELMTNIQLDRDLVLMVRLVVAKYLRTNADQPVQAGGQTYQESKTDSSSSAAADNEEENFVSIEEFVNNVVLPMDEDAEAGIVAPAAAAHFGVNIDIVYLDRKLLAIVEYPEKHLRRPGTRTITLLHRPGHYDILYHSGTPRFGPLARFLGDCSTCNTQAMLVCNHRMCDPCIERYAPTVSDDGWDDAVCPICQLSSAAMDEQCNSCSTRDKKSGPLKRLRCCQTVRFSHIRTSAHDGHPPHPRHHSRGLATTATPTTTGQRRHPETRRRRRRWVGDEGEEDDWVPDEIREMWEEKAAEEARRADEKAEESGDEDEERRQLEGPTTADELWRGSITLEDLFHIRVGLASSGRDERQLHRIQQTLARLQLPPDGTRRLIKSVLTALHAIHTAGLVHDDANGTSRRSA
ncbi:unnamed protein product [Vitrella brassicaformis CCMP3155]|uniref:Uncharacterized protein n=1 Tax=Vitrella brassicaformis (strain CCMP3155) TaxID=1169540 RepID=A0A0G4EQ42_VITBC|nr:unnamed protein product [Vitrella brassicaformis CCMP3155]|eukprot:CEL99401.1 unnamed protein product [Vitrella brassicaformis CCMP3155]